MRAAAGLTATRMMGAPRGVDLDLGQFDLSTLTDVSTGEVHREQNVAVSELFWSSIDDEMNKVFSEDDAQLLRAIFNSALSDRRDEGELFAPPDVRPDYVQRLRRLVTEEG